MTPTERTMPVIEARWDPKSHGYRLVLPGGAERLATDADHARAIVARECPGTAVRVVGAQG